MWEGEYGNKVIRGGVDKDVVLVHKVLKKQKQKYCMKISRNYYEYYIKNTFRAWKDGFVMKILKAR